MHGVPDDGGVGASGSGSGVLIPAAVRYVRASDVDGALGLLADPEAKVLAGGQSLIPLLKLRVARPSLLVDVSRLPLRGVMLDGDRVRIGALTTWAEIVDAPELARPALASLRECAAGIGDLQVRNLGTIGGSLVHADPASDMPCVLLALGASATIRSHDGERSLPVDEVVLGPFTSAVGATELVTEISIPVPAPGSGSAYASVEHPASGFALVGVAAVVSASEERLALAGVAGRPLVAKDARLEGVDVLADRFAPAEYRRALATTLAERALEAARARAAEDRP